MENGNGERAERLIEKYGFDFGGMMDGEWIEALEKNDTKSREDGIRDFVSYYTHYFGIEDK